jgi:hypothetical protein
MPTCDPRLQLVVEQGLLPGFPEIRRFITGSPGDQPYLMIIL